LEGLSDLASSAVQPLTLDGDYLCLARVKASSPIIISILSQGHRFKTKEAAS
jgi:hypothetical protein